MTSSFPQQVLEQAQIDAEVGRRNMPGRNPLQKAQDFLRDQLTKFSGGKTAGTRTPQQQVDFDAEVGRRVTKQQQKLKQQGKAGVKTAGVVSGLVASPGGIATTLATTLTSDGDQANKWRRLGYPSKEAYDTAMGNYEIETGLSAETGKPLQRQRERDITQPDGSAMATVVDRETSFDKGVKELNALEEASGPLPRATIGTDTGSGNREAPPPRDNMANASELERYKVFVKANPTIAAKVKPGQAGYEEIQAILNGGKEGGPSAQEVLDFADDSGYKADEASAILGGGSVESVIDSSGISTTITTPQTTSDPASPQDGTSGLPDVFDQSRSLSIPGVDPQEFLSKKVKSVGDILAGETNPDRFIFKD